MKIIGHRGARGLAPENTLAAIKEALKLHAEQIEVDVRVTKDGICVLHHDARLRGGTAISTHTLQELRALKPDLTTLEEALAMIARRIPMYIEVKPRIPNGVVAELLRRHLQSGWEPTDFMVASFSQKTLLQLHKELPELDTIVIGHVSGLRAMWRARQLDTKYIVLNHRVLWGGFIRGMHKRGWKLGAYTVNDPAKAERWAKHGLYAIVTDHPNRFPKPKNHERKV